MKLFKLQKVLFALVIILFYIEYNADTLLYGVYRSPYQGNTEHVV